MSAHTLSIKQAANVSNVSVHTLRYYERIGLLPPVSRDARGIRRYSERDLGAVNILLRLRDTGMSIQGMKQFASLLTLGDDGIPERLLLLEQHEKAVREKIRELELNLEAINTKMTIYRKQKTVQNIIPDSNSSQYAGGTT